MRYIHMKWLWFQCINKGTIYNVVDVLRRFDAEQINHQLYLILKILNIFFSLKLYKIVKKNPSILDLFSHNHPI